MSRRSTAEAAYSWIAAYPAGYRSISAARARAADIDRYSAEFKLCGGPGQDYYYRPLPTLKCYNLHALTIVIITKYIYIYFYTL